MVIMEIKTETKIVNIHKIGVYFTVNELEKIIDALYNHDKEGELLHQVNDILHKAQSQIKKIDKKVNPEVKTAKKYQSVNPALEQITVDRFNEYWHKRGQYETLGTLEHEAEEAITKASPGLFKIQRNTRRKRRR